MEFSIVMAYRPLDAEPAFKEVNKWLAGSPLSPNAQVTIPLNTLFTTFTRPTDTLYIYQEHRHNLEHVIRKLEDAIAPNESIKLEIPIPTPQLKTIMSNGLIE